MPNTFLSTTNSVPVLCPYVAGDPHVYRLAEPALAHGMVADCVGFTSMCHSATPLAIMAFLNQLYSRFDNMIDIFKVYKVETIGGTASREGFGKLLSCCHVRTPGDSLPHAIRAPMFLWLFMEWVTSVPPPNTPALLAARLLHVGGRVGGVRRRRLQIRH